MIGLRVIATLSLFGRSEKTRFPSLLYPIRFRGSGDFKRLHLQAGAVIRSDARDRFISPPSARVGPVTALQHQEMVVETDRSRWHSLPRRVNSLLAMKKFPAPVNKFPALPRREFAASL